jgi:multiple antibiotic resistance protein
MTWQTFLRIFIPLLVSIDPFGLVPVFMSVTTSMPEHRRRHIAFQSAGVAFAVGIGFIFLGQVLFRLLQITVNDFRIAGGILLLVLAIIDLLMPGKPSVDEGQTIGIVPLAMPLIAGPAMLTTSLMLSRTYGPSEAILGLAINLFLLLAILWAANRLTRVMNVHVMTAVSKLVMLLLAAIAVNFIRVGITQIVLDVANNRASG